MRRALFALALAAPLALAGCFDPDQPVCSYVCSESDPRCPEDYECRADNYCHLQGSTQACGFSDAGVTVDQSVTADMSKPTDLAETD